MDNDSEIVWFRDCSYQNKHLVGGKCSSLGELHRLSTKIGFNIAYGFAITTAMYDDFIEFNHLDSIIQEKLEQIDVDDISNLENSAKNLREIITAGEFTHDQENLIVESYVVLCQLYETNVREVSVRSSAIAEDFPNASFAGQQDTYLNIRGRDDLIFAIKRCFASLFNSRAISYRKRYNIPFGEVKISVAIQKMVRSDLASAGVAFSIDPESGYNKAVVLN